MNYEITFLPDEPICIITFLDGWDTPEGIKVRAQAFRNLLDQATEPLYLIVDFTQTKMSLDGVIRSANRFARGPDAIFHHPMRKEILLVSTEKLARMVAHGLQSDVFGHLHIRIFSTLEDALAHIRTQHTS